MDAADPAAPPACADRLRPAQAAAPAPDPAADAPGAPPKLGRVHWRRLRDLYRSAGWPSRDAVEIDLLAAGLVAPCAAPQPGALESLALTPAGIAALARAQQRNRAAFDAHEALVERVAMSLLRDGRLVWRGLALRAPVDAPVEARADAAHEPGPDADGDAPPQAAFALDGARHVAGAPPRRWRVGQPDVYSLRPSTRTAGLEPMVHEIKVRRADLLGELKQPDKRAAYLAVSSQCWYVLAEGIAEPDELPAECGVLIARGERLVCARPAPKRPFEPSLSLWLALARAAPLASLGADGDPAQSLL
jgi:hypothetical protein